MASDKYCAPPLPLHNLAPVLSLNIREISNSEVVFFNVSGNTCDVARTWSVNLRCSCSCNLKTRLVSQHSTGHSIKPTILFLACIRLNVTQKEQREKNQFSKRKGHSIRHMSNSCQGPVSWKMKLHGTRAGGDSNTLQIVLMDIIYYMQLNKSSFVYC